MKGYLNPKTYTTLRARLKTNWREPAKHPTLELQTLENSRKCNINFWSTYLLVFKLHRLPTVIYINSIGYPHVIILYPLYPVETGSSPATYGGNSFSSLIAHSICVFCTTSKPTDNLKDSNNASNLSTAPAWFKTIQRNGHIRFP